MGNHGNQEEEKSNSSEIEIEVFIGDVVVLSQSSKGLRVVPDWKSVAEVKD